MTTKTAVYLSEEDSERFVGFLKHYAILTSVIAEIESMKGAGSLTIHFDQSGKPRIVEKTQKTVLA